jgi:hypothetical protein
MKKPANPRLVLRREQVRVLEDKDLKHVAGGESDVVNCVTLPKAAPSPTPGG